jgi:hypothetical protein
VLKGETMKRHLVTLLLAALYVLAVSFALKVVPFDNAPEGFRALFTKSWHGSLMWLKIRHLIIVCLIACLPALLLLRADKGKAQIDAIVIGAITLLWGVFLRWVIAGTAGWSWLEVTDYLTTALAIPVMVAVIGAKKR